MCTGFLGERNIFLCLVLREQRTDFPEGYPEFEDVRQGCKKLCKKKTPPHIFSENCIFSGVDETIPCLHIHQRASASDTLRE